MERSKPVRTKMRTKRSLRVVGPRLPRGRWAFLLGPVVLMMLVLSGYPLEAQAEVLVKALAAAGVEHEHYVDADMPHGYAQMEFLPGARPAIDRMVAFLRRTV